MLKSKTSKKKEKGRTCEICAWRDFQLQDLPARQLCPPSLLLPGHLVSMVEEADIAERRLESPPSSLLSSQPAASCLLACLTEWECERRRECKGTEPGRSGCHRERERESRRKRGERKSTCHQPSGQPALETAPNQQLAPVWCHNLSSQSREPRPAVAAHSLCWS